MPLRRWRKIERKLILASGGMFLWGGHAEERGVFLLGPLPQSEKTPRMGECPQLLTSAYSQVTNTARRVRYLAHAEVREGSSHSAQGATWSMPRLSGELGGIGEKGWQSSRRGLVGLTLNGLPFDNSGWPRLFVGLSCNKQFQVGRA